MTVQKMRGFTLIEVMIVVAVLGVIIAIGYPSYTEPVRKSRRAEGMGELLELADKMERFYADRGTYAGASLGTGAGNIHTATTADGYYTLNIDSQTAVAFQVRATPTSKGNQNKDKCNIFILDSLGNKTLSGNSTPLEQCWK